MSTETLHIENVDEEIKVEVEFDYEPEEAKSWDYPGATASAFICEVIRVDNGAEICLLPKEKDRIEEILLDNESEKAEEKRQYKKYGYMLEDY